MQKSNRSIVSLWVMTTILLSLSTTIPALSQQKIKNRAAKIATVAPKADSVIAVGKPQSYDKVITKDAQIFKGVFNINKVKDRFFFEIPDSLLGRDMHVISRLRQTPAFIARNDTSFAGDELGDMQISFGKAPDNRLFVRQMIYNERATDTSATGLHGALSKNNIQPIVLVFDIKAYGKDSAAVIDVTDLMNGDNPMITGALKRKLNAQGMMNDRSYIQSAHAYPMNVEFQMLKTYSVQNGVITLEVSTSFLLLPKNPMQARFADERVGYKRNSYTDFDQDPQRAKIVDIISRWRLEPKPGDMSRYQKGELVEPAKPIVFYIDPAMPKKWVPFIIKAVNNWQTAFEQAGFKNAIYAKETLPGDTSWNQEDDRYNTIIYAPSLARDVIPSIITDPRSGEILHANIHIDYNLMGYLHNMYMVQAGAVDPEARTMQLSNSLLGKLMSAEVSANVGYTLGLTPNEGASSTVPVANLRNKSWVERYGISPSIMQKTTYNYVAQPEDHISEDGIIPKIGAYDRWAINWGYRLLPQFKSGYDELIYLRKITADSLRKNQYLYFGAAPKGLREDPRSQPEDLGDDAIKASSLGIQNLKRIVPQLPVWTISPDQIYSANNNTLSNLTGFVSDQFTVYMKNITAVFGTIFYNPHGTESGANVFDYVPLKRQQQAMAFLSQSLFKTEPAWMVTKAIQNRAIALPTNTPVYSPGLDVLSGNLLDFKILKNIDIAAETFGDDKTYSLVNYLTDLDKSIWPELGTRLPVSNYHRLLQRTYIASMDKVLNLDRDAINVNTMAISRGHLIELRKRMKQTIKLSTDQITIAHFNDLIALIDGITDPKKPSSSPVLNLPRSNGVTGLKSLIPVLSDSEVNY